MPEKKWYIVWSGKVPGVYDTWEECSAQVRGVKGAKFKSFKGISRNEAEEIFKNGENSAQTLRHSAAKASDITEGDIPTPNPDAVAVDAACSRNPGPMEYRIVFVETGDVLYASPVYPRGTNNIGEFLALVHAMAWMESKGYKVPIYSDSANALSWVRDKACKSKLPRNSATEPVWNLVDRALVWLRKQDLSSFSLLKWNTAQWGEIPADYGRK